MNDQERAVMRQALEALEKSGCVAFKGLACRCNSTCASYTAAVALRAALAQQPEPAQEPVAWRYSVQPQVLGASYWEFSETKDVPDAQPLYTAPPKRPRLTDEEIDRLWHDNGAGIDAERFARIARAVERKLKGE